MHLRIGVENISPKLVPLTKVRAVRVPTTSEASGLGNDLGLLLRQVEATRIVSSVVVGTLLTWLQVASRPT